MAGAKSFGISRATTQLGDVGISGDGIATLAGSVGVLDGLQSAGLPNPSGAGDPKLLAVGSLTYGLDTTTPDQIARVSAVPFDTTLGAANATDFGLASYGLNQNMTADGLFWMPSLGLRYEGYFQGRGDRATITERPATRTLTSNSTNENADPLTVAAQVGVAYVVTMIDAALIIPPAVNQPIIAVELAYNDGADTVVLRRWMGVGAATIDALNQQITLAGLNIVVPENADLILRFETDGEVGTRQSLTLGYYEISA